MKDLLNLLPGIPENAPLTLFSALTASTLLVACGNGSLPSGSGAGDATEDANTLAAIALVQPYVGIYQLQDGWQGDLGDQAFLSIRLTANDGTSEAALIDVDDTDNCIPQRFSIGEVRKDPFSNRVFMDDIFQFNEAELSLSANELTIQVTDLFDIDNDLDTTEIVAITATRVAITEIDLGVTCT